MLPCANLRHGLKIAALTGRPLTMQGRSSLNDIRRLPKGRLRRGLKTHHQREQQSTHFPAHMDVIHRNEVGVMYPRVTVLGDGSHLMTPSQE
jgi:hypothetical protein